MNLARSTYVTGVIRGMSLVALCVAAAMVVFHAPVDVEMGLVQKLIYLHLPAAISSFAASLVVFLAGLCYLWTRNSMWNQIARSAAIATVACSFAVLITGMVWAHFFWGSWWLWSPRLTFTLIMCVLYSGYLALQHIHLPGEPSVWQSRCAIYGCVAFLDVPLVYLSIRLLPDKHPTSLPLTAEMRETLIPCFVLVALICADMILAPVRRSRRAKAGVPHEPHDSVMTGTFHPQT